MELINQEIARKNFNLTPNLSFKACLATWSSINPLTIK